MASSSPITYGQNNPSFLQQQMAIQRQQELAKQLMEQGDQPQTTQVIDGIAVPQSSASGLARALTKVAGGYEMKKANDATNNLASNAYNMQASGFGATPFPSQSPSDSSWLKQAADYLSAPSPSQDQTTDGMPVGQAVTTNPQPSPQISNAPSQQASAPFKLDGFSGDDSMRLANSYPEAYAKMLENQHHMTDQQLNDRVVGIQPPARRALTMSEGAKNVGVSGGQYNVDINGNASIAPIPGASNTQADFTKASEDVKIIPNATVTVGGRTLSNVPIRGTGEIITPKSLANGLMPPSANTPPAIVKSSPIVSAGVNSLYPPATSPTVPPGVSMAQNLSAPPQSAALAPETQPAPTQQPLAQPYFGKDSAASGEADSTGVKTGENIADVAKTVKVMQSNLPYAIQRFQIMRDASDNANYGFGTNNEGTGLKQDLLKNFDANKTANANTKLKQASAQGILPELGPQLAQAGVKGNKFLETIANNASGLDLADPPSAKKITIDGLERTYIGNLKSSAAQLRASGQAAPTDAEIDTQVAAIKKQGNVPQGPANSRYKGTIKGKPVFEIKNSDGTVGHVMEQ